MDNIDLLDALAVMIMMAVFSLALVASITIGVFFGVGFGLLAFCVFLLAALVSLLAIFKDASGR